MTLSTGAVVVRAGLRLRMDHDGAGPELLRAGTGVRDRRGAVHAGRLRRVGVELVRRARRERREISIWGQCPWEDCLLFFVVARDFERIKSAPTWKSVEKPYNHPRWPTDRIPSY